MVWVARRDELAEVWLLATVRAAKSLVTWLVPERDLFVIDFVSARAGAR